MNFSPSISEKEIVRLLQLSSDPVVNEIWLLKNKLEKNRIDALCGYKKRLLNLNNLLKKCNDVITLENIGPDLTTMTQTMQELKGSIIKIYSDLANEMKKHLQEEANLQADLNGYHQYIK